MMEINEEKIIELQLNLMKELIFQLKLINKNIENINDSIKNR